MSKIGELQKIFELKDTDWMKGLSLQDDIPLGGIFQSSSNFNPFEVMGFLQPSLSPVAIDPVTITTQVNHLIPEIDGYVYALGDRTDTGEKCFYRIKLADNTVTDYSSVIDQNATTGAVTHNGGTIYGGIGETTRIIYEQSGSLRSNSIITPTVGNDLNILTSANSSSSVSPIDFCIGSDLNLYYTANQGSAVGKITTVVGTSGNNASQFVLEQGIQPRSLTSDGYYLVVMGDNNTNRLTTITAKCKVYFWDKAKSTADVAWDVPDSYLIGGRFVDGRVLIIGYSGIWSCNLHTPPKLVYPISNKNILPSKVSQIGVQDEFLTWSSVATGAKVYAYGSLIGKPILFSPYTSSASTDLHTALAVTGEQIVTATNAPSVYIHNTGSTRANAPIETATIHFGNPNKFGFIKCVLKDPLSSGQSVSLSAMDGSGRVILNSSNKAYSDSDIGPKRDLLFKPNPTIGSVTDFEDIAISVNPQGGAVIKRLTLYAIPQSDSNQTL